MIKVCQRCGNEFDALSNCAKRCPACREFWQKLYKTEYNRRYYLQNQESIKARIRQYKIEHRDECLARDKKYHQEHREKRLEQMRQWRANNPDYQKQWTANNPDKIHSYYIRSLIKNRPNSPRARLEFKKARLRAKLQATAAKRQAELLKHKELYQASTDYDKQVQSSPLLSRLI